MGPARTDAVVTGAAMPDEGGDVQRHGTDGSAGAGSDHSPDLNGLRGLDPALPVFDTSNLDRLKNGNTAPLASAATAASSGPSTTSGSLPMLQISANHGSCQNSDGDIDQPVETPTCSLVSQCQLGSACEPCGSKAAALADEELQEVRVTELEAACAGGSQEAQQTGSQRVRSPTDGELLQHSQCEHEQQNSELTVLATGNSCSIETRKRKLDQSAISLLDVTKSPGIPKQARVEDNCNFNNSSTFDIFPNECEVQHKLSRKLSVKQLIQSGARHRPMNDTLDEKTWPQSTHTDDVLVNLREQGDDRPPGSLQPQAASDRDSEASTQLRSGQLQSSEAQPDLWARMEVLCEPAGSPSCAGRCSPSCAGRCSPSCAGRCSTCSTPADTVIQRLFTEKNYVFQPGRPPKSRSWNPGTRPGNPPVAKHVLAYDDGYHHGNIKTRSHNTKRTKSQARSYSQGIRIKKTSSTSEHMVRRSAGHHRYRFRSNSSSAWSSRSRSRSHSPADSCRSHSCGSDNPDEYACDTWSSEDAHRSRCHCQHQPGPWQRCGWCRGSTPQSPISAGRLASSRSYSRSRYKPTKSCSAHGLDIIQQLLSPLVLPASVTTVIVAPVTGAASAGTGNGGTAAINMPSLGTCIDNKHPNTMTSSSPEKTKVNGGQNMSLPNMADRNKCQSQASNEASLQANANMSLPPRPQNHAHSRMSAARMDAGNPEHYAGPPVRSSNHFSEHSEHSLQREQPRYEPHYNNMGYHPDLDHSFSEDAGYEFYGGDYDYMYEERNEDYGFGNEPHPGHMHQRHPGPNTYYPRRPPPQGPRGPPQMFASNDRSYGPPRHGMGGPSSRMGPNGPVGSRGPRSPMGPRGHRPQGGPGGPLGPPVMRGPPRGSPYGPPRGSPYGPPGPMRPQGMRGPPGPGMMGQTGHGGPGGPRPRIGPPTRMQSPMPRQGSQPPGGLRPRMGPPPPGPAPREDQYPPPRPGILPSNSGDSSFCSPLPNLSEPPPNFASTPLPPTTSTPVPANQITVMVEAPPPLPPPKPPTPKPPPPPKKEEEKKEEIKPMTPLIPPEQAEQYRKLREQARKHARKQQRKQEHQAKGEPESSDDDEEEKAKRTEYEARLTAEREEMEKAALLAIQDNGALHYEEGPAILMPATQPALVQQPTMMVQHHPLASPPSSYGLMPASQLMHAGHPGLHPSQLQNLQFMTSAGQPQLVQLPNGQMAYATAAPMAYQAAGPMMAMQHQAMSAGAVPHHILLSSGGMHQVPVTAHPGLAVSGSPYMAQYVMATQVQAAQIQAAQMQAAHIQAAQAAQVQAAQIQAAQAAQVQAAQAAQVQAAQAAQVQAAQAAQVQAAQAQVQSGMPGLVSGVHMGQHVLPGTYPQGQYILVPRVARPQI